MSVAPLEHVRPLPPFAQAVLDALAAHVAVIDKAGSIVAVNEPWRRFARANGAAKPSCFIGDNYLAICRAAAGAEREQGEAAANGIEAVLAGTQTCFQLEYPCHGPEEQRWFALQVTRLEHDGEVFAVLAHEAVTDRVLSRQALRAAEHFNERILDSAHDCMKLLALDGTVLAMNRSSVQLLEVENIDLVVGRNWLDLWPGADQQKAREALNEAAAGRTGRFQGQRMTVSGSPSWWDVVVSPVMGERGASERILITSRDLTDLRAVMGQLDERNGRLDAIVSTQPECVKVVAADGTLLELNPAGLAYLEADRLEDVVGRCVFDLVTPESLPTFMELHDRALAGDPLDEPRQFEIVGLHGRRRWMEARSVPLRGEDGSVREILSVTRDVSLQREAVAQLQRSADTFYRLIKNNPFGIYVVDADFRLAEASLGCEKVFENVDELIDRDFATVARLLWAEPFATEAIDRFRQTLETGESFSSSNTIERRQDIKEVQAYDWRVERIVMPDSRYGVVCYFYDLSERRRWEAALQESERKLQTLVGNLPGMAYRCPTAAPWPLTYVSEGVRALTGYSAQDFRDGKLSWVDIVHADDLQAVDRDVATALQERRSFEMVYRIRRADGELRWVLDRGLGIYDPDNNEAVAIEGFVGDLTLQRQAEEELRNLNATLEQRVADEVAERAKAEEALRQSQKMEAIGQLTGGVAHDFNNLLTPIMGSLDLLQRTWAGDDRTRRLIDGALKSSERARTLVQRLLAFARRQPLRPKPVDVAELVRGMIELITRTVPPDVRIETHLPDDLPLATADPNQLEMAILNLAVNARDAMDASGTLTISAEAAAVGDSHPTKLQAGNYIRLTVADTGTGMSPEVLEKAIEPFFSTKGTGQGTGLGLSMVHGLAGQLGGGLHIRSNVGAGTAVELWLPVAEAEPGDRSIRVEGAHNGGGIVLLIDDEAEARASTAAMLADLGYSVVEAASGEEALARVEQGTAFDLLITDHLMPGMCGTELIDALVRQGVSIPALIITGYAKTAVLDPRLPRLTKPFRQHELAAELGKLLPATAGAVAVS